MARDGWLVAVMTETTAERRSSETTGGRRAQRGCPAALRARPHSRRRRGSNGDDSPVDSPAGEALRQRVVDGVPRSWLGFREKENRGKEKGEEQRGKRDLGLVEERGVVGARVERAPLRGGGEEGGERGR